MTTPETDATEVGFHHFRRVFRHAFTYGMGNLANRLVQIVLLPVYTRLLTKSELGVIGVLATTAGFLVTVLNTGIASGVFRFTFAAEDEAERRRILGSAFAYLTLVTLGVLATLAALRDPLGEAITRMPDTGPLVLLALVAVFGEVGVIVPLARLRVHERSGVFVLVGLLRFAINLALNVFLVVRLGWGVKGVLVGNAVATLSIYAVLAAPIARHVRMASRERVRALVRFGLPIMLASCGSFLLEAGDRWILPRLVSMTDVGVYDVSYRLAKFIHVFVVQPFTLAWPALMWSVVKRPEGESVIARVLTYVVAGTAVIALAASMLAHELFSVFAPVGFEGGLAVLPWVAFGYVFTMAYFVLNSGVSMADRTEYMAVTLGIALAVNVGINLTAVPRIGIQGAAIATFVAYGVMAVTMAAFSQRIRPIPYEWGRVAWIGTVTAVIASIAHGSGWVASGPPLWARLGVVALHGAVLVGANPRFLRRDERAAISRATARAMARLVRRITGS